MDVHPGDTVAVQGIGCATSWFPGVRSLTSADKPFSGLGHLALQFSRKMGYRTIALSSSDSKRQLAAELGAQEYIDGSKVNQAEALAQLGGAKVIMCTAPSPEVIEGLLPGLAVGGQLLVLALTPAANIPLGEWGGPLWSIHPSDHTL